MPDAGDLLGSYEILRAIGAGGMGEVYLARDTRLGRQAAIKILPTDVAEDIDRIKRFEQEARLASSLNHPGIATVYDVGEAGGRRFIAMEYVEGETLAQRLSRGPLSVPMVLDIGIQAADALKAAHDRGVTHRDIKPDNLMIRPDGIVKILDFGLAKLTSTPAPVSNDGSTYYEGLTRAGMVIGTVNYMSPEQARGEPIDPRSDFFSLGVVLFEALTGQRPFKGKTTVDVLAAILNQDAGGPSEHVAGVPAELDRIVRKAMRKGPVERYSSAGELAGDLKGLRRDLEATARPAPRRTESRRFTAPAIAIGVVLLIVAVGAWLNNRRPASPLPEAIESVAVLPFKHAGVDQSMAFLADGLTASVTSNLSQLRELRVMSRTTVNRFKDREPLEAGRALGVQSVLVGTVEPRGEAVTISLELIDVNDGRQLWGKQFPRALSDLVQLQSDISGEVAENLRPKLTGVEQQQLKQLPTTNAAAYQLYLRGGFFARQQTEDSLRTAVDFYTQAIALDPNFTKAHVGLAEAYILQGSDAVAPRDAMPKARVHALKALELEPGNADAHGALGIVRLAYDWDWKGAEDDLRSGHAIDSPAIETFSCALHYADPLGRNHDAIAALQSAVASQPQSLPHNLELGCASYYGRQYAQAIRQFRGTLAIYPNHPWATFSLGRALVQSGKVDDAITEMQAAMQATDTWPPIVSELGYAMARAGRRADALAMLTKLADIGRRRYVDPYLLACIHVGLGDKTSAFRELARAVDDRSSSLPWLKVEPKWDPLHEDPRFAELLRRVGLPAL